MTTGQSVPHSAGARPSQRVLVIVPTFNELENLPVIHRRLKDACPDVDLLVVDDGSPDGTGAIVDELVATDAHLHVLHRTQKSGLGAAYIAGFDWGVTQGYDVLVEMDADGSHAPEQLPDLLAALVDADLVIGSRWVPGGRTVDWPRSRQLISRSGNLYARLALGVGVRDMTGGYRAYRRDLLEQIDYQSVRSEGYCFQIDLAWRALRGGFRVAEVPITFAERQIGDSKMSSAIVREALVRVTDWGIRYRVENLRQLARTARKRVGG
jgi:dolichol-phosphate mannosyltransferase